MNRYTYIIIVALTALMFSGCEALDAFLGITNYKTGALIESFEISPLVDVGIKKSYSAKITHPTDKSPGSISVLVDFDDYEKRNGRFAPIIKVSPGAIVQPASGHPIDVWYSKNGGKHPLITYSVRSQREVEEEDYSSIKTYYVKIERVDNAESLLSHVGLTRKTNETLNLTKDYVGQIDHRLKIITFYITRLDLQKILKNEFRFDIDVSSGAQVFPDPAKPHKFQSLDAFVLKITSEDRKNLKEYTFDFLFRASESAVLTGFFGIPIDQKTLTIGKSLYGTKRGKYKIVSTKKEFDAALSIFELFLFRGKNLTTLVRGNRFYERSSQEHTKFGTKPKSDKITYIGSFVEVYGTSPAVLSCIYIYRNKGNDRCKDVKITFSAHIDVYAEYNNFVRYTLDVEAGVEDEEFFEINSCRKSNSNGDYTYYDYLASKYVALSSSCSDISFYIAQINLLALGTGRWDRLKRQSLHGRRIQLNYQ